MYNGKKDSPDTTATSPQQADTEHVALETQQIHNMKVAIIGGNLLGCSTAVYTRKSLDSNAAEACNAGQRNDTITIFERSSNLGGNKFRTLTLSNPTPAGTAASADIAAAPALTKLLNDANLKPALQPPREWAVFDWRTDSYTLCAVRSRILHTLAESPVVYLLQAFALVSSIFLASSINQLGINAFLKLDEYNDRVTNYPFVLWAFLALILGLGIIPLSRLLRLYNRLFSNLSPRIISGITYGGHSISMLSMHSNQTKAHIEAILSQDAATSCVTPGHFLSACGLAKFAKVSLTEFLASYTVHQGLLEDFITPSLAATYASTAVLPGEVNALAGLLTLLSRSRVPVAHRSRARYLDGVETNGLCDQLADAAGAEVKIGVEVTKVLSNGSSWSLSGIVGGVETELGMFDAVVLAAVIDPERFSTDAVEDISVDIAVPEATKQHVNAARCVNLVKGKLRADYVKKSSVNAVAAETTILNSVNCSEITQVGEDEWRVITSERVENGNSVADALFESIDKVVFVEQTAWYGCCPPIRNIHGNEVPNFVLGTRFLYAACTDRIANDVNIDVLSARNTASFFRDGTAKWK